jgi:serine/threonine-protein kinase PRP4
MDTDCEPGNQQQHQQQLQQIQQQQPHENRGEDEDGEGGHHETVAIKVVRNNDVMRRAAAGEIAILKTLASADPDGKRFCVRMLSHSTHLGHVVIVFEAFAMNLREALHKFGKNVGITIQAVRMYGRQLLVALRMLKEHHIVHADLKLDNILISGDLKRVKICDFGSAFTEEDCGGNGSAPYRVSRFYRAPEVILGLPQPSCAIDLWAVAVCLFELYTGKVMFPGCTNNDMMRLMLAAKGRLPHKVVKQHVRSYAELGLTPHFDNDSLMFRQQQVDTISRSTAGSSSNSSSSSSSSSKRLSDRLVEIPLLPKENQSVWAMVQASNTSSRSSPSEAALVVQLADLLDKCLVLNRAKRCSVEEALEHPFLSA